MNRLFRIFRKNPRGMGLRDQINFADYDDVVSSSEYSCYIDADSDDVKKLVDELENAELVMPIDSVPIIMFGSKRQVRKELKKLKRIMDETNKDN